MNDNQFQVQSALDGNYINIALQMPWKLDKTAIMVIKESCPDFLLPFGMTNINDEVTLKYKVPNSVSLKYMNGSFAKQMFLNFYEGLLEPFVKGYDWFLDYHYVCVIPDYVYVDKRTMKSRFLYIPEQSYSNADEEIITFLKNVLNKIMITDDSAFLVQLYQYFNSGNVVISELDSMIQAEKNKVGVMNEIPKPVVQNPEMYHVPNPEVKNPAAITPPKPAVQPPLPNTEPKPQPSPLSNGAESSDDDVMNALFGAPSKKKKKKQPKAKKQPDKQEKEEKGFFGGGLFGKKKTKAAEEVTQTIPQGTQAASQMNQMPQQTAAASVPVVPMPNIIMEDPSATTIDEAQYQVEKCLELIESERAGAIARISLDFPNDYITIGRESGDALQPDIRFDKSFKQISRMHLRIERKGDSYFAIDLGSGNHTLIDGQVMVPNTQYKLNAGTVLSIAANIPVRYRVNI